MKKTIILKGYYGRDNLGDEIMLDLLVSFFVAKDNMRLYVMNSNPLWLKKEYNIDTPNELITGSNAKKPLFKRVRAILKCDYYIIGGGTILTDKHGLACLFEYYFEFLIRKLLKKKSAFISIGATSFKTKLGSFLCKKIVRRSTFVAIRDEISYSQLLRMCPKSSNMFKTGDIVSLCPLIEHQKTTSKPLDKSVKKVCICPMPYYSSLNMDEKLDSQIADSFVSLIKKLNEEGKEVVLLPIQCGSNNTLDYDFCKTIESRVAGNITLLKPLSNEEKINAIGDCDCLISMRLHALLIGVLENKKVIAINHNPKIEAFMKSFGLETSMVNMEGIDSIYELMLSNSCKISEFNIDNMRSKALLNFDLLDELLK